MIYLDHNATSPLRTEAVSAMGPWLGVPANPSSAHRAGQRAAAALERAREQVAALAGGSPAGVVFTSGATEANHLFLRGVVRLDPARRRLVLGPVEHPCVFAAAGEATDLLDFWPVSPDGVVTPAAVPPDTAAVSLMAANHEIGTIQPLSDAVARAREAGARVHVDATQAVGRIPLPAGIDGLVFSSHKLGGPPGIGALVLPDAGAFPPLFGGFQERGRRAGTVPVLLAVGFGEACRLALAERDTEAAREAALSACLRDGLRALGARIVGDPARLLPNTTCAVFPGLRGEAVVQALDLRGVCVSSGAACASGSSRPSPVLRAIGDPEPSGGVRFSLGPSNTGEEIGVVLRELGEAVTLLREFL